MKTLTKWISSALVLSHNADVINRYKAVCDKKGIMCIKARSPQEVHLNSFDVIIADSRFCEDLIKYRDRVYIVNPGQSLGMLLANGYYKFVFDIENASEIMLSLLQWEDKLEKVVYKNLVMDFPNDRYFLNKKEIFLTKAEKRLLMRQFLTEGGKDFKKSSGERSILCRMRKRFGEEFPL